jgi:rhodanese-related sulfurtransferase
VKSVEQLLVLVLVSGLCALVHGLLRGPLEWVTDGWGIALQEARLREPVLWVDARPEDAYEAGHWPGAYRLGLDDWSGGLGRMLPDWDPESTIVVYCDGEECQSSRKVAARLRAELESETVFWLVGGWESLKEEVEE